MSKERTKHRWFGLSLFRRICLLFLASVILLVVGWLLYASGREALARWRFSRADRQLTAAAAEWKARAEQAEGRAAALDAQVQSLAVQLQAATIRAEAADAALVKAQNITVRVKDDYNAIRNRPLASVPAPDGRGLCSKLAAAGYPCSIPGNVP